MDIKYIYFCLCQCFQKDADKIRFKYPCTAHILDNLAEDYKHHAQEERENV